MSPQEEQRKAMHLLILFQCYVAWAPRENR